MRVLITRSREDGESLAKQLTQKGHTCILLPLINIVPRSELVVPQEHYQAICLTSANGIATVPDLLDRNIPVLCVGPQSAASATAKGFANVVFGGGDVEGLVALVQRHCSSHLGPLLYPSGAITSGDLEGKLQTFNYTVRRIMAYDAKPLQPSGIAETLSNSDAVVLYSQRTAQIWQDLITSANLNEKAAKITSLCLSQKVASSLPQSWIKRTAVTPDEASMLRLIDTLT